jgi:hypothetical protein
MQSLSWLRLVVGVASLHVVGAILFLFSGCGTNDPLGRRAVNGTVTLDGVSLANGTISLQPTEQGTTSSGAVISEGKYAIPRDKGLPKGKYRVVINAIKPGTGMTLPAGKMPGEEVGTPPAEWIPPEWNSKSQQFVEVPPSGAVTFAHEITTKKK